jgi:beta-N-acetylglucosaminidase
LVIGDDWFTKTMLVNTLCRNQKLQSQLVSSTSDGDNLFATVLNQLLMEKELQATVPPKINSLVPSMFTAINPSISDQNIPLSTDESLSFNSINPQKIDQVLDGKLKGMGEAFIRAGKQFNIDPALLAAISQHETGNGKSHAANEKNNIAGMMGINGLKSYSSIEESIIDMARNLSKNYVGLGLSSISKIGAKYAPRGAGNDPTGLNNHWVSGVSKYFDNLKV